MTIASNISLVTVTGQYVDYEGNPIAGQIQFRLPLTLLNALADQIVVPSVYSVTLDPFGQFSITIPATSDPNFNETFQYTIIESFSSGRTWQASLPGVDSFEDIGLRYATFNLLTATGSTFSQLVGVSSVKMSSLVPAYSGDTYTELAAYQAYVFTEAEVSVQEPFISYSPAGIIMPITYGGLASGYLTYASVVSGEASYGSLSDGPFVSGVDDVTPYSVQIAALAVTALSWADLAVEQAEELFPHPFVFTGSLGVRR